MSQYEIPLDQAKVKALHERKKATNKIEELRAIYDEFNDYIRPLHFRQKEVAEYIFLHGEYVPYYERRTRKISEDAQKSS